MTRPAISGISPLFIVRDVTASVAFYRDKLDFGVLPQEPEDNPFFAIVCRDGAMLMLKAVDIDPLPNRKRHPWARWDAYMMVSDPDALADEFLSRGLVPTEPLKDTEDGLRGFELEDADGYVLFFGRPREDSK